MVMQMNEVYEMLERLNINYKKIEHKPVYTVEEAQKIKSNIYGIGCKNLFLKSKSHKYYLYVLREDKKADLKSLSEILQCGRLSFASEDELFECLKLKRGSVTPFGILNDDSKVTVILDKELKGEKILVHPNVNTATVSLGYEDLLKVIRHCNNEYMEI